MEVSPQEFKDRLVAFQSAVETGEPSAAARYGSFHDFDPYEGIPPALLNSGHLASYALACGMIEPFEASRLTKPATYLVGLEGDCRYIDQYGSLVTFYLSRNPKARRVHLDVRDRVILAPNSLCYLTLAPEFRLPAYLGARFNLVISQVYRGLIVGTGPLVDPGFEGRLSIPIHNFTNQEYQLLAGEGLVYFEFTKLSWSNPPQSKAEPSWLPAPIDVQPPFPKTKSERKRLDDYLSSATGGGRPPASSIGITLQSVTDQVNKANRIFQTISVVGIATVAALFFTAWSLYIGVQQFTASAQNEVRQEQQKLQGRLDSLERQVRGADND